LPNREKDLQAASEIGKIYNSFLDKKLLCEFFLQSVPLFIGADRGWLFLAGADNKLWVEAASDDAGDCPADIASAAKSAYEKGQPVHADKSMHLPLIVRNGAIGVASFTGSSFTREQKDLAFGLASQLAGALKTIMLYEQTLKMERLAAVGRTTSMVMHEIKNILQLAMFSEQWIREGISTNNTKFLERGQKGMSKMLKDLDGFVYEMLSLTKDYQIQPQPMNLIELLSELAADLESKASGLKVKLDFQAAPDMAGVEGEPRSISRALLNIVKNALEAGDKEDSWIKIRAQSVDKDHYVIEIEDNGQGMTDEVKANIFQAFYSTKGERGTGLGLMIIDKTVKAHQGKIQVESELGKGTRFILTFPKKLAAPVTSR